MKIQYLHLHNFAHVYSGLGVRDIYLDFSQNHKVINVIIGKMGSCKTVILGHLQPFATFGTVDSRNQDGVIIAGEDGLKEIHIRTEEHLYKITHTYTWKNGHHVLKSFLFEDDRDLNPSGSPTNFKLLVEAKLELEQSMLTLLRLGPNVTNMIDMGASARKSFMSSLLQDTEIYTMLYKKLNEDLRNMTAQVSVMTNRLAKVSKGNILEVKTRYEDTKDQIQAHLKELDTLQKKINDLDVEIRSATNGMSIAEYTKKMDALQESLQDTNKKIIDLEKEISSLQEKTVSSSINEILVEMGAGNQKEQSNSLKLLELDRKYQETKKKLDGIQEAILVSQSKDQIDLVRKQYQKLQEQYQELCEATSQYSYRYDAATLRRILSQINTINILINDIALYNPESVQDLLQHREYAIKNSKKKSEILSKLLIKLQKRINNVEYLKSYKPEDIVFFPPDCPTHDCPYYRTHPVTVSEEMKSKPMDEETQKTKDQMEMVEKELGRYSEYPLILSKINSMQILWEEVAPILDTLHLLKRKSMKEIFSSLQSQIWYDHDGLLWNIERSEQYELRNTLSHQLDSLRSDMKSLGIENREMMEKEIISLQKDCDSYAKEAQSLEEENRSLRQRREKLDESVGYLTQIEKHKDAIYQLGMVKQTISEQIQNQKGTLDTVEKLRGKMEPLLMEKSSSERELNSLRLQEDQLRITIGEYESTSKDLKKIQEDQEILKYIVEAVSSSKGIPLVYIQLFLRSCKEDLNDLISDVFGDQIEVLDFIITQDEFKIPYTINGTPVDDIAKASQGQRSIISLALSFALIRQSITKYNILLLDEMDGPLYASDRSKFLDILYKQIADIQAEQIFLVSHNNTFEGHSVNIIMTTDEHVEENGLISVMNVYGKESK